MPAGSNRQSVDYDAALPGRPWRSRRRALRSLFEHIEPRYDGLNRFLSLGLDQGWRRWAATTLATAPPGPWLDLASGTGDLALALQDAVSRARPESLVVRADLSASLLRAGSKKIAAPNRRRAPAISCEMDRLPFRDGSVAALAQGFALRHCRDLDGFFLELVRVLRPGGRLALLDMRYPRRGFGAFIYRFYFRRLLPRIAAILGGERAAYEFMVESVRALPDEPELLARLTRAGFAEVESRRGFLGAVCVLIARRPS